MFSMGCHLKVSRWLTLAQIMLVICMSIFGANGQISTPCTNSIVSSFTPCFNFVTGSSANGSSPTQDCCDSLKSIMTNMIDCACLIVTGNVPFSIPFVRTLVLSLPLQQCNSGVPVQCKGSGVPLPAPGPTPAYNSPPAYSPRPHHHPARPPRAHPPTLAPHSSRVSKDSVAPSPAVEPPVETPAPLPPPAAEQPKKKAASNPPPPPVEASKEKGAAPPKPAPVVPKKLPGMSPVVNPSKTAAQANSSPISSSSQSLWLLLFVVSVIFVCQ